MTRVKIESLGHRGDGLSHLDGKIVHISKVLPGEVVKLVEGRLSHIVSASPERIEPFCPHYARCGGCKFQHWKEAPYRDWKRSLLLDALAARQVEGNVAPLLDAHGDGRRRVSLHVRQQSGQWRAGFMEQKTHDLVALEQCPVLESALRHAPKLAAAFGPILGPCDVAITAADNGLDVSIRAERKAVPRRFEALNTLMQSHAILRLSINGESFASLATPTVKMGRAEVPLPVQSFLQPTRAGENILAGLVKEGIGKPHTVADLFCGLGPFALRLAEYCKVTALDSDKAAIACLQIATSHTQGLKPLAAETRDLFREPLTVAELKPFEAVVLDPPRAGAEAQARMLAKSRVPTIVMVACDVGTFARDAAILLAGGYRLQRVTPVDQFKWTAHLEMVGVFVKD